MPSLPETLRAISTIFRANFSLALTLTAGQKYLETLLNMIIQARKKKGKAARGCIKEGGKEKAPRRNRKKPLRWEKTTNDRVRLRAKSCRGMAKSGARLLEGGRRWMLGVMQLQRVTRGRKGVSRRASLPSLTRLSNFDTIKTERINLHPSPTPSAGSRRDASGEEMV